MNRIRKWIPAYLAVDAQNRIVGYFLGEGVLSDIPNQTPLKNDSRPSSELLKQMDYSAKNRSVNL